MSDERKLLAISDVTHGWAVRIEKGQGRTFVGAGSGAAGRAFFVQHADARAYVHDLRAHRMTGRIVRARLILKTEA